MSLNIAICDDEPDDITRLQKHILQYNMETDHNIVVSSYLSADTLLSAYHATLYDVVLLDIEMPGRSGMDLARQLREIDDELFIVFTTSYPKYMQESFEVQPFQFLQKPVGYECIRSLFDNIIKKLHRSQAKLVVIDSDNEKHFVALHNILFISSIKGGKSHIRYQLPDHELISKGTLTEIESRLTAHGFISPSRGFLVNIHHIKSLDSIRIVLNNGMEIPVSRRKFKELQLSYSQYMIDIL